MKFGEQPAYSRQAYEETEKGIQDVKDAAKGSGSVEELRTLASEKNALEAQKTDLHGQAWDEATKMNQERDALAQERAAQEKSDAAEADRLRAEILGETAASETASVEVAPVEVASEPTSPVAEASEQDFEDAHLVNRLVDKKRESGATPDMEKLGAKSAEEMDDLARRLRTDAGQRVLAKEFPSPALSPEQPVAASKPEVVSKAEVPRGFFDKVKSFFSGEKSGEMSGEESETEEASPEEIKGKAWEEFCTEYPGMEGETYGQLETAIKRAHSKYEDRYNYQRNALIAGSLAGSGSVVIASMVGGVPAFLSGIATMGGTTATAAGIAGAATFGTLIFVAPAALLAYGAYSKFKRYQEVRKIKKDTALLNKAFGRL